MADLSSHVAIVTGGTRGIGREIVRALAARGASVVLGSRSASDAEAVAADLDRDTPGQVMGVACDVRDPDACERLVDRTIDRFGSLSLLVNNAGIGVFAALQELAVEDFRAQIETNLCGVFYCARAAAPHLSAVEGGWIINIGSLAGRNAFARGTGYNASKFGLVGLSEAMMLDLRYEGVRVSLIMPGSVNTSFTGDEGSDAGAWKLQSEDVAQAVLDLLAYPDRALPSKIEMRPSQPPRR